MDLTKREKEVYEYLSLGLSNEMIAKELNISTHTAKAHIASILHKFGTNRIYAAYLKGLLDGINILFGNWDDIEGEK